MNSTAWTLPNNWWSKNCAAIPLLGLDKLLEARLMDAPANVWEELSMVKNLVHGYTQKLARYQCSHCGFKARQYYWQCPGCSKWETYPPRRTEELNVMN